MTCGDFVVKEICLSSDAFPKILLPEHTVGLPFETIEEDGFIYVKRKRAACGEGHYTVVVVQVTRVLSCHDVTHKWYDKFYRSVAVGIHRVTVEMLL